MRKLMLLLAFLACAAPAWAQRAWPADAQRTRTGEPQVFPLVQLGSATLRLAPGGVIIDPNNRSITHNQLPPGAEVVVILDRNGDIVRLVILTAEEQARLDGKP